MTTEAARTVGSSSGVRIVVHELGGDGPPLLFAHATGFCGPVWRPVAAHLTQFRCVALDFRAHGRSTRPDDGDLDWAGTGDDVLAVIDALHLEGVRGVGHSMGGAALLLAEQARPSTFGAMWLYEPVVIVGGFPHGADAENPLADGAARRRDRFPSARAAIDNYASKPPLDVFTPEALAAYVEGGFDEHDDGSVTLRCRPEDESGTFRMGPRNSAASHLDEVRCPVTIVTGRDEPGPASFAAPVADGLAHGRLVELRHLGHFGPMQDPAAIAASIAVAFASSP